MTARSKTGWILLATFLGIFALDGILWFNALPTFSQWMARAADVWPFATVAGLSFGWGFLSGHWAVPTFKDDGR